jgi:hypothetical protein
MSILRQRFPLADEMRKPDSAGEDSRFEAAKRQCERAANWPNLDERPEVIEAGMDVIGRMYLSDEITADQRDELYKTLNNPRDKPPQLREAPLPRPTMSLPTLKPQEIPLDHPDSTCMFRPGPDKPFLATPAAIAMYGNDVIVACLTTLRERADQHRGLDYLQVFEDPSKPASLWFMEDGDGGAITALLPSDY